MGKSQPNTGRGGVKNAILPLNPSPALLSAAKDLPKGWERGSMERSMSEKNAILPPLPMLGEGGWGGEGRPSGAAFF